MKSKSPNKIWIIHGCALFLFVGLNGLFFILGGGSETTRDTNIVKESLVDPLPEIFTEEVADNRLDAYNKAIALIDQEQKEKELQDEHNSFHFFAEEISSEETPVEKPDTAKNALQEFKHKIVSHTPTSSYTTNNARRTEQASPSKSKEIVELDEIDIEKMIEEEKKRKSQHLREIYLSNLGEGTVDESSKKASDEGEQKVSATPPSIVMQEEGGNGFKPMIKRNHKQTSNCIHAVVHDEQKNVTTSSQVKLRILDPLYIDGTTIPANTIIYGSASFNKNRVNIKVNKIVYNGDVYTFSGTIYDQDGEAGIYFPENLANDVTSETTDETIKNAEVNLNSLSGIALTGAHAITNATRNAFGNIVRETKVTLTANYNLIIKINE